MTPISLVFGRRSCVRPDGWISDAGTGNNLEDLLRGSFAMLALNARKNGRRGAVRAVSALLRPNRSRRRFTICGIYTC